MPTPASPPTASRADALRRTSCTGKTKYWDGGQAAIITVLPDKTDAALQQACGMDTSSVQNILATPGLFPDAGEEPKKAADAAELVQMVAATKGAIAIAPADAALDRRKKNQKSNDLRAAVQAAARSQLI